MNFEPIGYFHGSAVRKYDQPRQGVFSGTSGKVELLPGNDFETALRDLQGFERIWLIFVFDRNGTAWRRTTRPPVGIPGRERIGLFASRAPYRPNPIGLSCVKLEGIKGLTISVSEADLLDGTPILDIKPYVPKADAFPDVKAGWVDEQEDDAWEVEFSEIFSEKAKIVFDAGAPDIARSVQLQLSHSPFDSSRKRVQKISEHEGVLSLRMFRIDFTVNEEARTVVATDLRSGYTLEEMYDPSDPYEDKVFHTLLQKGVCFDKIPLQFLPRKDRKL